MSKRSNHNFVKRTVIDIAGFGLIIISPFVGWLPGPGGIPIFIAGVAILSRNYDWAENLLHDFDKKRVNFTNKYLMTNKKVSRTIDSLSIFLIILAVIIIAYGPNNIIRYLSIGVATFSIFILVSNQKRIDKFMKKLKK